MNHDRLAQALLDSVRAQDFGHTEDGLRKGRALTHFPSLDLAVAAFPGGGAAPVWANVLFSREHPQGFVASIPADGGTLTGLRFDADQTDAALDSVAWLPEADWSTLRWQPLHGHDVANPGPRFVAPYPASLLKVMVAIGVARLVDAGRAHWDDPCTLAGRTRRVADWAEDMIVFSSNDGTTALVALLHRAGAIRRDDDHETHNELNALFAALGLPTLRLTNTRADGGWGNAAGAGVGQIQMTAWDTLRLFWLLDADAPAAPWQAATARAVLSAPSRARLRGWLDDQALHEILSSSVLRGVPGWRAGIPAQLPARWITADGSASVDDTHYPADVRDPAAQVRFAHKTGTTENYGSDGGIVRGIAPHRRHYLVVLLSSLGSRYATHQMCAVNWRLPALGAAIDAQLAAWLES